ncbi:MAG: sporulation protein YqfD [Lachnospiraceae bacterium]
MAAVWLLLWLGAHVWRITLNGNVRQTSPVLYNWLQENGIYYGMRKSEVDCERLFLLHCAMLFLIFPGYRQLCTGHSCRYRFGKAAF